MRLYVVAAAYAAWFFLLDLIFYLVQGHGFGAIEASVLLGLVPMGLQILLLGFNPIGMVRPVHVTLAFLAIILLSYLANGAGWDGVSYVILYLYLACGAITVAGSPDRRLLPLVAEFYSIPAALWLLYMCQFGSYLWGRLYAGLQPNVWGLTALSVGVAALAHRSRITAAFCLGAAAATMYEASSRSNMLGLLMAGAVIGLRYLFGLRNRRLVVGLGLIAFLLVIAAAVLPALQQVVVAFNDNLWKLDDPSRGLGSGASGRFTYWQAALNLWWQHPWFGVGYRMHEQYMPGQLESHNAFIAMLADCGLFGLLWYAGLLIAGWRGMLRLEEPRLRRLAIGLIVSYTLMGLFERRAVDAANPMSWMFLIVALLILRDQSVARLRRPLERAKGGSGRGVTAPERGAPARA